MVVTCERCGAELQVADWPFCPHGRPLYGAHGIQTDESFIGGQVIENLDDQPVTVYSRRELNYEMEKRGLEQRIKYVPGDHHLTNWAQGIDPQTLENAKALLSRPRQTRGKEPDYGHLESIRVTWQKPT